MVSDSIVSKHIGLLFVAGTGPLAIAVVVCVPWLSGEQLLAPTLISVWCTSAWLE